MEDVNQTAVIPATYDELQAEVARLKQLNLSTEARLDTATRAKDAALAARNELQETLAPLVSYFQEQLLNSNEFADVVRDQVIACLETRDIQSTISDMVNDCLENVSIELNIRR